ncbi:hypothetical protein [Shewanella pneumatophori]|uniref:Uncharacterized protein n=1 Tax=Shewanella pneumatophori TaxID=314092 RepID=A0A9X2CGZ3_9GAMM|nr:hypothetical protein [Shewanella pneumatophori]MCL1137945.1 hypothetical protein [Shewanella pneumatophori]
MEFIDLLGPTIAGLALLYTWRKDKDNTKEINRLIVRLEGLHSEYSHLRNSVALKEASDEYVSLLYESNVKLVELTKKFIPTLDKAKFEVYSVLEKYDDKVDLSLHFRCMVDDISKIILSNNLDNPVLLKHQLRNLKWINQSFVSECETKSDGLMKLLFSKKTKFEPTASEKIARSYSIQNAFKVLSAELSYDKRNELFQSLIPSMLEHRDNFNVLVTEIALIEEELKEGLKRNSLVPDAFQIKRNVNLYSEYCRTLVTTRMLQALTCHDFDGLENYEIPLALEHLIFALSYIKVFETLCELEKI